MPASMPMERPAIEPAGRELEEGGGEVFSAGVAIADCVWEDDVLAVVVSLAIDIEIDIDVGVAIAVFVVTTDVADVFVPNSVPTWAQSSCAKSSVAACSEAEHEPCMHLKMGGTCVVHMQGVSRRGQEPWVVDMQVCYWEEGMLVCGVMVDVGGVKGREGGREMDVRHREGSLGGRWGGRGGLLRGGRGGGGGLWLGRRAFWWVVVLMLMERENERKRKRWSERIE